MIKIFRLFFLILFSICLKGCNDKIEEQKYHVISKVFYETIGKYDHFGEPPPLPKYFFFYDSIVENYNRDITSEDSIEFEKIRIQDSVNLENWIKESKKRKRNIMISNKLLSMNTFKDKSYLTDFNSFQNNFDCKDTLFFSLIQDLLDSEEDTINLEKIENETVYNLIPDQPSIKLNRDIVGIASFSQVVFSHDMKYAAIYSGWYCGGECGVGSIYILEYDRKIWRIICERMLFVS